MTALVSSPISRIPPVFGDKTRAFSGLFCPPLFHAQKAEHGCSGCSVIVPLAMGSAVLLPPQLALTETQQKKVAAMWVAEILQNRISSRLCHAFLSPSKVNQ